MKLTGMELENWMCHRRLSMAVAPLTLICGPNDRGKSAIGDALAFGLVAELRRIEGKGDRARLVTEGAERGSVTLRFGAIATTRDIASGKLTLKAAVPTEAKSAEQFGFVSHPSSFAALPADARRVALLKMMGVAIDPAAIGAELEKRGRATKLMGAAFRMTDPIDKWHEAAKAALSEARGAWKGITGEAYGSQKAVDWKAEAPEAPTDADIAAAHDAVRRADVDINVMQRTLGMLDAAEGTRPNRATLEALAARVPDARSVLAEKREEERLAQLALHQIDAELSDVRSRQPGAEPLVCPECGSLLKRQDGALERHSEPTIAASSPDELKAAQRKRDEAAAAHRAVLNAIIHCMEDLQRCQDAEIDLRADAPPTPTVAADPSLGRRSDVEAQIAGSVAEKAEAVARLEALRSARAKADHAATTTKRAADAHQRVQDWTKIAEDLAPEGIQADLLAKALTPFNDMLRDVAAKFKWPQPRVQDDMRITLNGRPYALWSESQQWRADTVCAIAIAATTKLRLVVLDRFDVLEIAARGEALAVLYGMTKLGGLLDTCLLIGTLKAAPAAPKDVAVHWLGDAPLKAAA